MEVKSNNNIINSNNDNHFTYPVSQEMVDFRTFVPCKDNKQIHDRIIGVNVFHQSNNSAMSKRSTDYVLERALCLIVPCILKVCLYLRTVALV